MITEHALNRYMSRVVGILDLDKVTEIEKLKYFKELTYILGNSKELYNGCFCTKNKISNIRIDKDIALVVKNNTLVTLWKINNDKELIKKINKLKLEVNNLKSKRENVAKQNISDAGAEIFLKTMGMENNTYYQELLRNIENRRDLARGMRDESEALEILISFYCYQLVYNKRYNKNKSVIAFFVSKQGTYNPTRVDKIVRGLNSLKERGIFEGEI